MKPGVVYLTMRQIDIIDDIYESALKIATAENRSVREVIEEMLRNQLRLKSFDQFSVIGAMSERSDVLDEMMSVINANRQMPFRAQ